MKNFDPTKLYLHMGPGFHSLIEKKLFSQDFPGTEFWSQPAVSSFSELLLSTENKFSQMKPDKVDIVAHSFGAQLAVHLVNRFPEKVGKVVLLNSGLDPFDCFINLALKLGLLVESEVAKVKESPVAQKMDIIFKVATTPKFPILYWYSEDKMKKYSELFSQMPQLDVNIFASVFADFLISQNAFQNQLKPWSGDVTIIASEDDCLLNYKRDVESWTKYFPKARFNPIKKVGHYAHIESDELSKIFLK